MVGVVRVNVRMKVSFKRCWGRSEMIARMPINVYSMVLGVD